MKENDSDTCVVLRHIGNDTDLCLCVIENLNDKSCATFIYWYDRTGWSKDMQRTGNLPAKTRAARKILANESFIVDKKYGSGGTRLVVYSTISEEHSGMNALAGQEKIIF